MRTRAGHAAGWRPHRGAGNARRTARRSGAPGGPAPGAAAVRRCRRPVRRRTGSACPDGVRAGQVASASSAVNSVGSPDVVVREVLDEQIGAAGERMGPADHHDALVSFAQHRTDDDVRTGREAAATRPGRPRDGGVDRGGRRTAWCSTAPWTRVRRLESLDGPAQDVHAGGGVQQAHANHTRPTAPKRGFRSTRSRPATAGTSSACSARPASVSSTTRLVRRTAVDCPASARGRALSG